MKRKFNFTESELFTLCLTGWDTCIKFLSFMVAFSPKYTAEYVAGKKEEILNLMKNFNQSLRSSQNGSLRLELVSVGDIALKAWQSLKLYVEEAFLPDEMIQRMKELGFEYYKTGSRKQWKDLSLMLIAGKRFIEENQAKLLENGNMPPDFSILYDKALNDFQSVYASLIRKDLDQLTTTEDRLESLNKIYTDVKRMFAAGQVVFKDRPSIKRQFQFTRNLKVISGAGWSGIKGRILDENGQLILIDQLEILVKETEDVISQEDDGSYLLNHLPSGSYTLVVMAPGYKTLEKVVEVKVDNYTTLDWVMEKEITNAGDEAA